MDTIKSIDEMNKHMNELSKKSPDEISGFMKLKNAVVRDAKLDKKTKELIALGCAVVQRCEPCINFHVKALFDMGVPEGEMLEAAWVAVLMGGGPSLMYALKVLKAMDDLR